MTLNNYSLQDIVNVLSKDYSCTSINIKIVWLWRLKLIHALAALPMPKLTGIIQVNELHSDIKKFINTEIFPMAVIVDDKERFVISDQYFIYCALNF